jgi:hypothetical protein
MHGQCHGPLNRWLRATAVIHTLLITILVSCTPWLSAPHSPSCAVRIGEASHPGPVSLDGGTFSDARWVQDLRPPVSCRHSGGDVDHDACRAFAFGSDECLLTREADADVPKRIANPSGDHLWPQGGGTLTDADHVDTRYRFFDAVGSHCSSFGCMPFVTPPLACAIAAPAGGDACCTCDADLLVHGMYWTLCTCGAHICAARAIAAPCPRCASQVPVQPSFHPQVPGGGKSRIC